MSTFAERLQDKTFGPCEICERDSELKHTHHSSGEWSAWICYDCLGEVEPDLTMGQQP